MYQVGYYKIAQPCYVQHELKQINIKFFENWYSVLLQTQLFVTHFQVTVTTAHQPAAGSCPNLRPSHSCHVSIGYPRSLSVGPWKPTYKYTYKFTRIPSSISCQPGSCPPFQWAWGVGSNPWYRAVVHICTIPKRARATTSPTWWVVAYVHFIHWRSVWEFII